MNVEIVINETPIEITVEGSSGEEQLTVMENGIEVLLNNSTPSSISEVPDVFIQNLQPGDTLVFDESLNLWRNISPAAVSGDIDGGTFF